MISAARRHFSATGFKRNLDHDISKLPLRKIYYILVEYFNASQISKIKSWITILLLRVKVIEKNLVNVRYTVYIHMCVCKLAVALS